MHHGNWPLSLPGAVAQPLLAEFVTRARVLSSEEPAFKVLAVLAPLGLFSATTITHYTGARSTSIIAQIGTTQCPRSVNTVVAHSVTVFTFSGSIDIWSASATI